MSAIVIRSRQLNRIFHIYGKEEERRKKKEERRKKKEEESR